MLTYVSYLCLNQGDDLVLMAGFGDNTPAQFYRNQMKRMLAYLSDEAKKGNNIDSGGLPTDGSKFITRATQDDEEEAEGDQDEDGEPAAVHGFTISDLLDTMHPSSLGTLMAFWHQWQSHQKAVFKCHESENTTLLKMTQATEGRVTFKQMKTTSAQ